MSAKKYTSEQFWKLYENLPQELKDAFFAEETGDNIFEICKRNDATEEQGDITDYVSRVLVGILPPEDLQKELEKEVGLKKEVAKKVAQEINRYIFYPVKPALEELYKIEIAPPAKPTKITPPPEATAPPEEEPPAPPTKDVYREPIE